MNSEIVLKKLRDRFGDKLVAVALFGSTARGEAKETSDLDFLVVLRGIPWSLSRRYSVYKPIYEALNTQKEKPVDISVVDIDEEVITNENVKLESLMFDIIRDAKILYDPENKLQSFLKQHRAKK